MLVVLNRFLLLYSLVSIRIVFRNVIMCVSLDICVIVCWGEIVLIVNRMIVVGIVVVVFG